MIKKIFSFLCCLLPVGAGAVVVAPGTGGMVSTTQGGWNVDDGVVISDENAIGIESPNVLDVNNMTVGAENSTGLQSGDVFVLNSVLTDNFTLLAGDDVSINALLTVLNGKQLSIKANDSSVGMYDISAGGLVLGMADATAALNVNSGGAFVVSGNTVAYGDLTVDVDSIDMGGINTYAGSLNLQGQSGVVIDSLIFGGDGGVSVVAENNVEISGDLQVLGTGGAVLQAAADITVDGALENKSGDDFTITANSGALVVGETMTNESQNATMTLNVESWQVNGGTDAAASVVNKGNFYAIVENETSLANGFNLSGMGADNEFSLDTGTLVFGADADENAWFELFANKLKEFAVTVRGGNLNLGAVLNGADSNTNASMNVGAQNLSMNSVVNNADVLSIKTVNNVNGTIDVSGAILGASGSTTTLTASGALTVGDTVSNAGSMSLSASEISLADVSNVGTEMNPAMTEIKSVLSNAGKIVVGNLVNKNGMLSIEAKDVQVNGVIINSSGTLDLFASDTNNGPVQLNGAIEVLGGEVNLNALVGAVTVGGALNVTQGNLNLGTSLYDLTVQDSVVQIAGSLVAGNQVAGTGNINIAANGVQDFVLTAGSTAIAKNVIVGNGVDVGTVVLDSGTIDIGQGITVNDQGILELGAADNAAVVDVVGQVLVNKGATLNAYTSDFTVGAMLVNGQLIVNGAKIVADNGGIDIIGNLYFDGDSANSGLVINTDVTDEFTLQTTKENSVITVGAINVMSGKSLTLDSAGAVFVDGTVYNQGELSVNATGLVNATSVITNTGGLDIAAGVLDLAGVENSADVAVEIVANSGNANIDSVVNTGDSLTIRAEDSIVSVSISNTNGGVLKLTADTVKAQSLVVNGDTGTQLNLNTGTVDVDGNVRVGGDLVQGGTVVDYAMLNHNATDFYAGNLLVDGGFIVNSGNTMYSVDTNFELGGDILVAQGSVVNVEVGNLINASSANINNSGILTMRAMRGMVFAGAINNSGTLTLDSMNGLLNLGTLTVNSGNLVLNGTGLYLDGAINTGAMLYQNVVATLGNKDINIIADNYNLTASSLNLKGINQDGSMLINSSDINIGTAGINADDLRFVAQQNDSGDTLWQNVRVEGNVSGNVDFIGLEKMKVFGSYTFNNNSSINAAILPYAEGTALNTTDVNYWATVSLNEDKTLGQITNPTGDGAGALISVDGEFETDITLVGGLENDSLANAQIGIDIFDVVDTGTAIWLLHADNGIIDLATKIRNLNVRFCNADGTLCYSYFDSLKNYASDDSDDLPVYIAERDTDGDFQMDSLYIVFDPRFGGPVEVFKIQPIVGRQDEFTFGEYVSAGAIDDMVAGQLVDKKFNNRTPIEAIPVAFKGTNLSKVATELYNRMEYYVAERDGTVFVPFSRLFQVRELEQIAGNLMLNEHTSFRSFEDRMLDEFIWNRGRKLKKAWLDMDYGMYFQNVADGKHADGNRFSVSGGFDWQATNTLMLGLTGRITHSSSDLSDAMDLGYGTVQEVGQVGVTVADTNIGLGAYLMETVNEKARIYGNAFLDLHVFDVERVQNFVAPIDGTGTAFSLISEWGLMHDILNQYIVGNLYARAGYNFGFSVTEKVSGSDYMKLKSDGYFIFTPGYSLIAQKRIYPSAWFQIRPYASVGVEYDVLGMPDNAKYKFAVADRYTYYDIDTNPFWANIGAGVEFLAANGVQIGVDYRYQYNSAIQLHNIKFSGSYRF